MRHGLGLYEIGFLNPLLWMVLILTAVLIIIMFYGLRKKSNPTQRHLGEILNIRFAKGEIGEEKYHEIRMILDDENNETPSMLIAKERFAKGDISSEEFIKTRDVINSSR